MFFCSFISSTRLFLYKRYDLTILRRVFLLLLLPKKCQIWMPIIRQYSLLQNIAGMYSPVLYHHLTTEIICDIWQAISLKLQLCLFAMTIFQNNSIYNIVCQGSSDIKLAWTFSSAWNICCWDLLLTEGKSAEKGKCRKACLLSMLIVIDLSRTAKKYTGNKEQFTLFWF